MKSLGYSNDLPTFSGKINVSLDGEQKLYVLGQIASARLPSMGYQDRSAIQTIELYRPQMSMIPRKRWTDTHMLKSKQNNCSSLQAFVAQSRQRHSPLVQKQGQVALHSSCLHTSLRRFSSRNIITTCIISIEQDFYIISYSSDL